MATIDELNAVIKGTDMRLSLLPSQKEEIVSFMGQGEIPISICRIKSFRLPEISLSGNHMFAVLSTDRVLLVNANTQAAKTKFYFRPINLREVRSVSPMDGGAFDIQLNDESTCHLQGWKKHTTPLHDLLIHRWTESSKT